MLDFFFNLIEKIGIDYSLVSSRVGLFFEPVDFGYLFVVFVQNLLDIVLHLFNFLLVTATHEFILGPLSCLYLAHFTF